MKNLILGMSVIGLSAFVMSCGSGKDMVKTNLSGEWNIVQVGSEALSGEAAPFLGIDLQQKRVYGNAGCNRIMGGIEYDSLKTGKLRFTSVASTRMMCPNMDDERKVLEALDKVTGYIGTDTGVSLVDEQGNVALALEKRRTPACTLDDLAGDWMIAGLNGNDVPKSEKIPSLSFDIAKKQVGGNAGCNNIGGGFEQEEGKPTSLKFTQMISTMMMCPDIEVEKEILMALDKVRGFKQNENASIALLDEAGNEIITLIKVVSKKSL